MTTRQTKSGTFRSIRAIAAEVVADMHWRREIKRLHRLGPRVLAELLAEIAAERGIRVLVERKIDKFASINPETLEAAGGDAFWPVPIRRVPRT